MRPGPATRARARRRKRPIKRCASRRCPRWSRGTSRSFAPATGNVPETSGRDSGWVCCRGLRGARATLIPRLISFESANQRPYRCEIQRAEDLHDPVVNLRCGVKILSFWVGKDGNTAREVRRLRRYLDAHPGPARVRRAVKNRPWPCAGPSWRVLRLWRECALTPRGVEDRQAA